MLLMLLAPLSAPALAGYGDVVDGYPNWAERELHLYTNAARVDPAAFEADYNRGGCSYDDFSTDEQTPKAPVYYSYPLNDAARFHSDDMHTSGNFSHDSSDGTSFGQRLARFYTETSYVGENIAYGYPDNWAAMMEGWMCSTSGHRENIMSGGWTELGTGVVSNYYTQDFGGGSADSSSGIRMGVHVPERPTSGNTVTFYADWSGPGLSAISVVFDGEVIPMELHWGDEDNGVYIADAEMGTECLDYYFVYEGPSGEGAFPEDGAYLMGSGCSDVWEDRDATASPGDGLGGGDGGGYDGFDDINDGTQDVDIKGCSTTSPVSPVMAWLGLIGVALLRRRQD